MLNRLLYVVLCLGWLLPAQAQDQYYYADDSRIDLSASSTHFIVTADRAGTLVTAQLQDLDGYQSWSHKPYAVYASDRPTTVPEVIATLGFDTDEVQVSPGYAYEDGFVVYPTRTVVARLADKADQLRLRKVLADYGIRQSEEKYGVQRIELDRLDQVFEVANRLQESGAFAFAQPDFYAPVTRYQQDPLFGQQFQMHNTGQTIDGVQGANDADCNALEAWGISLGSASITVAVIDDGLEDHEDLRTSGGQSRYTAGFSPANNGNGDAISGSDHGVACAGSIAASHNTLGVRGVAPLVDLISVNIFVGGESTQDIADGFTWAKNQGADVMSNSWGYTSCTASFSNINNAMADANSNGRGGLGSVVVFASGNGYKACVDYPANNNNVVAVGAFSNQGIRSAYSNYGPTLDIMAPSNNVGGPGAGVRTTDRMGGPGYAGGNYTNNFGGTSSACPVVAGVAALVLGYNPSLSSSQLKTILYNSAIDMGPNGNDNEYANGRVNALGALQAAGGTGGPTCSDGIQNGQETGVDCGGPDCQACPTQGCNGNEVLLSFVFDNYPEETSWTITNDAGQIVESGGTYGGQPDGSSLTIGLCLVDGCYTLTINDSYGDGICCAYGSGSYSLSQGGTVLASGGSFGASDASPFCVGDPGQGPDTEAPSTPTNLTASNETESSVDLSWNASTDNVGVSAYEVYEAGTLLGNVAGTSATVNGLTACTTYDFAVVAIDEAGNGSGPATTSATTTGCTGGGGNGGLISGSYFESGWDGWTDGGSDCYRYRGSRSWEGDYSIRIRDNSGTASAMTSPSYDLSGLASVEVSWYFYPYSMENGEDFWLRYNDGSGWQTVATYARGTDFQNNTFYSASVTLDASSFNLSNNARFRFQCDASGNADQIYVDEVIITGFTTAGAGGALAKLTPVGGPVRSEELTANESEFRMTPNPASNFVTVTTEENLREVSLYSITGARVLHQLTAGVPQATIDVRSLPAGVYVVQARTEEETMTERIVVRRE